MPSSIPEFDGKLNTDRSHEFAAQRFLLRDRFAVLLLSPISPPDSGSGDQAGRPDFSGRGKRR